MFIPAAFELVKRFDELPDDAILPTKGTALILGVSERSIRTGRVTDLPRIQISDGRYGQRVGDIRAKIRAGRQQEATIYVVPRHNELDGINAVRKLLNRSWIDSVRCERGLEALRQYRREWDDARKDFRDAPLHNWCSHAADALRYFAAGYDGQVSTKGASDRKRDESAPRGSHWAN